MIDDRKNWQTLNLAAIQQRLAWVQQQPDGMIFCKDSGVHYVAVKKERSHIKLALVEKVSLHTDLLQSVFDCQVQELC